MLEYTSATGIMFTTYGMFRYVKNRSDIDSCTKYNLMAGLSLGFVSGGIMLKRLIKG